jgi:hypothetical protein
MRKLGMSYAPALALARESRPQITPNSGFEKQLRIWEFCQYSVLHNPDGTGVKREKAPYKAWKEERLLLLKDKSSNRARLAAVANMAASFGQRRQEQFGSLAALDDKEADVNDKKQERRSEAWQKVQDMEAAWNEKLMRGEVTRQP